MMDWTDRHCRYFHRVLSRRARLYTEMVTTGALLHGDAARHLEFDPAEQPVALQLGGSDPQALARCARLGAERGYAEINLNCGCPSDRVRNGTFGACLMAQPRRVAECLRAMRDAVPIPVTVKHRIGLDRDDGVTLLHDFVGTLHDAGVRVFIVHARNAWLQGLSPRENREIPPLRYDVVRRLKQVFPSATIVVNGGIGTLDAARAQLDHVDGVMLGRAAYEAPAQLARVDPGLFDDPGGMPDDATSTARAIAAMSAYLARERARGTPVRAVVRHMLGLGSGMRGARAWRRALSDPQFLERHGADALHAAAAVAGWPTA
ncbi:MAG TPA: tRNA dihydrouridine(20/20a) synthase DusA [Burkholderiaceae bacterium]|nr:tRNA dihydrouridine(20/20a) synthase DusA [Burkholderiaceae bacterium]